MAERTGYTDNFMVPEEEITAFAGKVKEAVADRDMDALASLPPILCMWDLRTAAFRRGHRKNWLLGNRPHIHTGIGGGSGGGGDETLSPSMAGFVLKKDGTPNIVFGYPRECWPLKELIIDGLILTNHT